MTRLLRPLFRVLVSLPDQRDGGRLLATPYADGAEMARIVEASDLDWTIVYLNRLTNARPTGRVHTSRGPLARPRGIARADAAATLLDIVADTTLVRTAVNVAGG